ncbi:UDP-N-acetylmuramoyl-L-alanine--D-glutamate ligase [Nocardioides bruguierae]|uniref:UDP-N-acetylmuramoylalanine--D-glutamate ligase n=1 Tax=Nocardioides bruguierae TaxID=2945102 RepID=A0A9X2D4Y4_9ACTN|nr:UDP-N-acetylmuramoyl-L-alanine--D-glutamate ligase [Nocardioides bruguierae]MCM0619293.1 UDP-N-acetylmuramoyl-L-alanine--D-glutamate ligase [Nocardioides bruguierae]
MRYEDLAGRAVVVWGTGREGRAAHAELTGRGVDVVGYAVTGGEAPADLADLTATGEAGLARMLAADVVVKSPGVPHTSPEYVALRQAGVAVTSLTDLWLSADPDRVVGVTGTKGKSTTSAIVRHLLEAAGRTASLVGNGGTPVTADDASASEIAVTEVSSYQAAELSSSPRVAVVTCLYPEHLPWHGGFEAYAADKLNLLAHGTELVVLPHAHDDLAERVRAAVGEDTVLVTPADAGITVTDEAVRWSGVGTVAAADLQVHGRHNLVNVALALTAVALGFDLPEEQRPAVLAATTTFAALAHRLETIASADGRRWVDDSLATAPEAVVAALGSFAGQRVALVLGGADRGLDMSPLRTHLAGPAGDDVRVLAIGPAGTRWVEEGGPAVRHTHLAGTWAGAVAALHDPTGPAGPASTDVVLLSPGAPSFDEFASYEERSAAFRVAAQG